jgi:hypothetical protein
MTLFPSVVAYYDSLGNLVAEFGPPMRIYLTCFGLSGPTLAEI